MHRSPSPWRGVSHAVPLLALVFSLLVVGEGGAQGVELPIGNRPPLEVSVELESRAAAGRAVGFLLDKQGEGGAWHDSALLTSLVLGALAQSPDAETEEVETAIRRALEYLRNGGAPDAGDQEQQAAQDGGEDGHHDTGEDGLSRQAETVLRIMTAVSGRENPRLAELAERALDSGRTPVALEAAVVTAVQMRECLVPANAASPKLLQRSLSWACRYYGRARGPNVGKQECRTFVYVLGRALQAIRADLPNTAEASAGWRQRAAVNLLNTQKGGGNWACPEAGESGMTAATAFALLLFGQILG